MTERFFPIGQRARVVGGCTCGARKVADATVNELTLVEVLGLPVPWPGVECACLKSGEPVQQISLRSSFGNYVFVKPKWLEPWWDGREPLAESETEEWVRRLVRPARVKVR